MHIEATPVTIDVVQDDSAAFYRGRVFALDGRALMETRGPLSEAQAYGVSRAYCDDQCLNVTAIRCESTWRAIVRMVLP